MLQVTELRKTYGSIHAVDGIGFTAASQEAIGLLGQNGAGKSTTMRMLAGYLAPTSGDIVLDGLNMAEDPIQAKRRIGYLPELPPLYMDSTVREHLRFVCALRGIAHRDAKRESERVCDLLSIGHVASRVIGKLSKGYRQRVGFAAALIGNPSLLILDEPTVGLDPQQVIDIRRLILMLSKQMTVLISSHVLSEIASVCTHLLIMHQGQLLADGSAQEITDRYREHSLLAATVRGERLLACETMARLAEGMGTLAVEEHPSPDVTGFVLRVPKDCAMAERVFQGIANHRQQLSLLSLQERTPSLEDVFIDITQGRCLLEKKSGNETVGGAQG